MQSPFFIPDESILEALKAAALAGVEVKLMFTPRGSTYQIPYRAAHTYFKDVVEAGAEVYLYEAGYFHPKTLNVDNAVISIGTANMGELSMTIPYQKIHIVINPASGKDEPIINTLNDVFHQYGVDWEVSITKKYGDATAQAKAAIANGVDLVVGYGGDGTQHEIANAVLSSDRKIPMGILPGGTGNGFAREMGIPKTLRPAVEVLCTSSKLRLIDVAQVGHQYFIQRLYVGIEPEEQTSREMKNKYGVFAYAISMHKRSKTQKEINYQVTLDGEAESFHAIKLYVVNSGMMGTGFTIMKTYAIDDGLLDAFFLDKEDSKAMAGAIDRFLNRDTESARKYYRQCREITIDTDPDQPVWFDGEYLGRTPITVKVQPGALSIVVPENHA